MVEYKDKLISKNSEAYNILGEHRFFTMDDLRQIMSEREVKFHDHHTERTNQ